MLENKRLLLDENEDAGFAVGTIANTGIMYQRDWADLNSDGDTAARMGAYAGNKPILRLLFKKGWNPRAKNFTGTSVRQTASDYGQNDVLAKWIKEYSDHGHITDSLGHSDFRRTDIDDHLPPPPATTFGRMEQKTTSRIKPDAGNAAAAYHIRKLTKEQCHEIENNWKNDRSVSFRLASGALVETKQVNTNFDLAERDLMYERIQTLEEEKKQLELYISEKLSAMQLKFKEDLSNITNNQRKEMNALAENFDRFVASPPPGLNNKK